MRLLYSSLPDFVIDTTKKPSDKIHPLVNPASIRTHLLKRLPRRGPPLGILLCPITHTQTVPFSLCLSIYTFLVCGPLSSESGMAKQTVLRSWARGKFRPEVLFKRFSLTEKGNPRKRKTISVFAHNPQSGPAKRVQGPYRLTADSKFPQSRSLVPLRTRTKIPSLFAPTPAAATAGAAISTSCPSSKPKADNV